MRKRKNIQQPDEDVRYESRIRRNSNTPKEVCSDGTLIEGASGHSASINDVIPTIKRVSGVDGSQIAEQQSLKDIPPMPLEGLSEQRSFLLGTAIKPPTLDERISSSIFDFPLPSEVSSNSLWKPIPPKTLDIAGKDHNETFKAAFTGNDVDQSPKHDEEGFGSQVFEL